MPGEEGRHPSAVHEMIPVKIDSVPLTAHAEKMAVRFLQDIALCTALIHKAGVRVRLQKKLTFPAPTVPDSTVRPESAASVRAAKSGIFTASCSANWYRHRIFSRRKKYRSLKRCTPSALRLIHELLPRVCRQIIHQIPYGHKVAQLLFGMRGPGVLLEVCHNGQDLREDRSDRPSGRCSHSHLRGKTSATSSRMARIQGNDLCSFHRNFLPFRDRWQTQSLCLSHNNTLNSLSCARSSDNKLCFGRNSCFNLPVYRPILLIGHSIASVSLAQQLACTVARQQLGAELHCAHALGRSGRVRFASVISPHLLLFVLVAIDHRRSSCPFLLQHILSRLRTCHDAFQLFGADVLAAVRIVRFFLRPVRK